MRAPLGAAIALTAALALAPACADAGDGPVDHNVLIQVLGPAVGVWPHVQICVDARVTSSGSGVTWSNGDPTTQGATRTIAEADGAVCVDLAEAFALAADCAPGTKSSVTIWTEGVYPYGIRDFIGDYENPCADGCTSVFDCPAVGEPAAVIPFDLVVMRNAHQGFFDFAMNATTPGGTHSVCIDLRATNRDGVLLSAEGDPTVAAATEAEAIASGAICSTRFGNAGGGDIAYVVPCDAVKPQTTATVWIKGVYFDDATPLAERVWRNPCPPATRGTAAEDWTGGCRIQFQCLEDQDVSHPIDIDLVAGTSHL